MSVALLTILFISPALQANERGAKLYKTCVQCHGENGYGDESQEAPRIAGQHDWYIYSSLVAFQKKERKNEKMYPYIQYLTDQDFKDLASHVSSMK